MAKQPKRIIFVDDDANSIEIKTIMHYCRALRKDNNFVIGPTPNYIAKNPWVRGCLSTDGVFTGADAMCRYINSIVGCPPGWLPESDKSSEWQQIDGFIIDTQMMPGTILPGIYSALNSRENLNDKGRHDDTGIHIVFYLAKKIEENIAYICRADDGYGRKIVLLSNLARVINSFDAAARDVSDLQAVKKNGMREILIGKAPGGANFPLDILYSPKDENKVNEFSNNLFKWLDGQGWPVDYGVIVKRLQEEIIVKIKDRISIKTALEDKIRAIAEVKKLEDLLTFIPDATTERNIEVYVKGLLAE